MRTFISVELPENVKRNIYRLSEKIKNSGLVSGRFVDKDNLHLTLRFLGELNEEEVEEVKKLFSDLMLPSFDAYTGKIGFFPSNEFIKIMWIDFVSDDIMRLRGIVENKLQEIGIPKEKREFSAHITFARIKGVNDRDSFFELVKNLEMEKMKIPVKKISLIKSDLTSKGPIYSILGEFELI